MEDERGPETASGPRGFSGIQESSGPERMPEESPGCLHWPGLFLAIRGLGGCLGAHGFTANWGGASRAVAGGDWLTEGEGGFRGMKTTGIYGFGVWPALLSPSKRGSASRLPISSAVGGCDESRPPQAAWALFGYQRSVEWRAYLPAVARERLRLLCRDRPDFSAATPSLCHAPPD